MSVDVPEWPGSDVDVSKVPLGPGLNQIGIRLGAGSVDLPRGPDSGKRSPDTGRLSDGEWVEGTPPTRTRTVYNIGHVWTVYRGTTVEVR